ncbi:PAS domain S-box protein [Scytonema sp. PCC 10023]|uniref:PAS domain S-box protein n=1 Tax=Scytonema sp. PCC 10023 TaxID=1680591 RepID=UPI0039C5C434
MIHETTGTVHKEIFIRSRLLCYGVAILAATVALLLTQLLLPLLNPLIFPLFFAAVAVSAWYGGMGPGLLAIALGVGYSLYFLIEPIHSFVITSANRLVQLIAFSLVSFLIALICTQLHVANRKTKASLRAVRQANRQVTRTLESISDAFVALDRDWRIIYQNAEAERLNGKSLTEVIGKTYWEEWSALVGTNVERQYRRAMAEQIPVHFEHHYYQPPTSDMWLEIHAYPHEDGLDIFFRDITDRKQAEVALREREARLRLALRAAKMGTWQVDLRTGAVQFDEALNQIFGLSRSPQNRDEWRECLYPEDRDQVEQVFQKAVASEGEYDVEYRIVWSDGSLHWVISRGDIIRDEAGQPIRAIGVIADISERQAALPERKQAQQELQKTLQTLSTLIKASPLPIVVIKPDMTVQLWNPATERLFGWSETEVLGQLIPIVPEEKREECCQVRAAVAKGEIFAGVETYRCKRDGSTVIVSISAAPLYDESGSVNAIVLIFQDITEQQQAESALRESEERAQLAIKVGRLGIWRYDPDTNLVELDERMREIWGEPNDVLKIPLSTVIERIHPDDRTRVASAVSNALDPKLSGTYEIDYRIVCCDGTERWVSANGQAQFEGEGIARRPIGFTGTALDITDRKQTEATLRQSEERYRYLAESIPQLVWTANTDGMLIDVNQRWSDFTGLTLTQAQTAGWEAIVHPDDLPTLSQNWAAAQQAGTSYRAEGRMRGADGEYRWHLHQAVPLKNEQGQVIKWFGTATDIENQKQLDQQRQRLLEQEQVARAQAETANRIKDEFLAVLSHELRSPLNPILGWSKLLLTGKLDATKTTQAIETIERNAKLQAQLIEDLLDVSRILRGKLSFNMDSVNLASTISAAIETVQLAAQAKSIQIQTVLDPNIGQVLGDSARLQQVIWNLLSNAVKFTLAGGRVEIRLQRVSSLAQITVSDTGKGIDPDFLPHVFEYFRQEDGATTRKFGGLGLGLAIVRHLVELHGGTVRAESAGVGQGATFTVSLPLLNPEKSIKNEDKSSSTTLGKLPLTALKILVVDDEVDTRELIAFILEQAGGSVITAVSAMEALQVIAQTKFDVLVSDIGMPDMDGYMLMRQIRVMQSERNSQIRAIALTAYAGEIDQQQALAAGFQLHIPKPIDPEVLIEAIAQMSTHSK